MHAGLRRILSSLHFPLDDRSELELEYFEASVSERHREVATVAFNTGAIFHLFALGLDAVIADQSNRMVLIATHSVAVLGLLVVLAHRRWRGPVNLRPVVFFFAMFHSAAYAQAVRMNVDVHGFLFAKSACTYLALSAFGVTLCPYSGFAPAVLTSFALACAYYAAHGIGQAASWMAVSSVSLLLATVAQRVRCIVNYRSAELELEASRLIAPAYVVKLAAASSAPLETIFRPSRRSCACVSIAWRNYETLAYNLPSSRLVVLLEDHYAACERALAAAVPSGAYYSDAMIDELFVVIFDDRGDVTRALRHAYAFAQGFLTERAARTTATARLARLDVGIASGEVLVGLMGPKDYRKTTGLGEAPGRAARLKSAGTILAAELGAASRILMSADDVTRLNEASGLRSYMRGCGAEFRDLGDVVFYWDAQCESAVGFGARAASSTGTAPAVRTGVAA